MLRPPLVLLYCLCLLPFISAAQDEYYPPGNAPAKPRYTILLKDGTELRGEIVRDDTAGVVVRTPDLGEIQLRNEQILQISQERLRTVGEVDPNLFSHTMRLSPTAFQPERGRLYYRNYNLYINQLTYGINDFWSVGGTLFTLIYANAFTVSTKVSVPLGSRVRLGAQAQYAGASFILFDGVGIGYVQGIVTTGDRQKNTTYGLGWTISAGRFSRNAVGTFGLVRKLNPKLTFISENFVLFGRGISRSVSFAGALSGGVRFDRRRHAFDVALYVPGAFAVIDRPVFTVVPFGSYHLRMGQ